MYLTDPRRDLTKDSWLWEQLLLAAYSLDSDNPDGCFAALHGMRCMGAKLVPKDNGIGVTLLAGEMPEERFRELRRDYLLPHKPQALKLFARVNTKGFLANQAVNP